MFILPPVMVLLLVLAIASIWGVGRLQGRFILAFLVLAVVSGVVLWQLWLQNVTYTVSGYINNELAGSYEEDYRTGYKLFVTGELATILSAGVILVVAAVSARSRVPAR
jgi:hypothetical protein